MDKKEGSGSHNWGTFEDEMKAEDDKANSSGEMNDSAVEATDAHDDKNAPNEIDEAKKVKSWLYLHCPAKPLIYPY